MALAIMVLTLIISGVSLFFVIKVNIKLNRLVELKAVKPLPRGRKRALMDEFEDFDVEEYVKKQREEEEKKRKEEEQKEQMQDALEALKDNPELLAAIMKMV